MTESQPLPAEPAEPGAVVEPVALRGQASLRCIETSVQCEDCQHVNDPGEQCRVLGVVMLRDNLLLRTGELESDNSALIERNANLSNRIDKLGKDRLLQIYSPAGLVDLIENNPLLREELAGDSWGIIYLDVRFLKYYNDEKGRQAGDDYLISVRDTIMDLASRRFRQRTETVAKDSRRKGSPDRDILWRAGGDEIGLLVRGVNTTRLEIMRYRLSQELSVEAGQAAAQAGQVPAVASVAACHATDVARHGSHSNADSLQLMATLDILALRADMSHGDEKKQQYAEMWNRLRATYNPLVRPFIRRPVDDRAVAGRFLDRFAREAPGADSQQ